MRRRRAPAAEQDFHGTPERLVRFEAEEWPAKEYQAAADMWWRAREEWEAETGRDAFILWDPMPPDESFDPSKI